MTLIVNLKALRDRLLQLPNAIKIGIGVFVILSGVGLITFIAKHHTASPVSLTTPYSTKQDIMETPDTLIDKLTQQLNNLRTQLTLHERSLTALNQQQEKQQQLIATLQSEQAQQLTKSDVDTYQLATDESIKKLTDHITHLQAQVDQNTHKLSPPPYLSASALPFRIDSIDLWNGLPYVAITEHQQHALLGLGDNQAGWILTHLNVQDKTAIFKNAKQQHVHVQLSTH